MKRGVSFAHSPRLSTASRSSSPQVACCLSGIWFFFVPFFRRDFRLKKEAKALRGDPGAFRSAPSRPRGLRSPGAKGKSGDGGVDGVIKEDKLGLDLLYTIADFTTAAVEMRGFGLRSESCGRTSREKRKIFSE